MRNFAKLVLATFILFLFCTHSLAAQSSKIGVVDIKQFQMKSAAFQRTRAKMQKKFEAMQKKLDAEKGALVKLEEDLRKQGMMLSLDAQEDKKLELEKKRLYYKYLYEDFTFEMKAADAETTRVIGRALEKIVSEIGKKEGFTIIFEKRALGLLYFDEKIDITDRVIEAYDKSH